MTSYPTTQSPLIQHDPNLGAAYPVSLSVFQGPLDLLLHLIEKQELEISEVSLLAVTDQYLQTIDLLEEIEPGALADFLVVASRLLYIKSRELLPKPRPPEEDEEESGDDLIRQLLEYRQFKRIAEELKVRSDLGLRVYVRTATTVELERRLDLSNVDLAKLHGALRKALQRIPNDPPPLSVRAYTVTVSEQMEKLRSLFRQLRVSQSASEDVPDKPIVFRELLGHSSSRVEVIVTFLAVLELIKQLEVRAMQEDVFGEILLAPIDLTD